ncbi:hypothetical protein [Roseisalinus antarcticus]|uniref:Uncharacterized protein n=1 Tax=Roseisalinus antarcticus TaxID=254357 RepID=A0A1Y5TZE3_9RHOB|nr:hypothetical protein [Roseisalinus antarcticus]SLN75066.1 hypothetical protein ROA7023_03886 [Roseisalinus antarcticus]
MTKPESAALRSFLWQRVGIWAVGCTLWGVSLILAALFTPLCLRLTDIWTSPDRLGRIEEKVDLLTTEVRRATGEDRLIRQTAGLSYVTEPVCQGETIVLNVVAAPGPG